MPGDGKRISKTQLIQALEASLGRADRERLKLESDDEIAMGRRGLWVVDNMDVEVDNVDAEVSEEGDEVLIPRSGLSLSFGLTFRRLSAKSQRDDEEP